MSAVPVFYRQALVGERLRHYGTWTKFVPLTMLERVSTRLPPKPIWREQIPCGEQQVELCVFADTLRRQKQPSKAADSEQGVTVYSRNLTIGYPRQRFAGRLLSLGLLRRVLPNLTKQLQLLGDRLAVALAVAAWERPLWVLGLEPYVRSITVLLESRESAKAIGYSGVAIRQSSYLSGRVDAHVLVYSPSNLERVRCLSLPQDTLLICTDGLVSARLDGCLSMEDDLPTQLGLPEIIWAEQQDQHPVLEKSLIAASLPTRKEHLSSQFPRRLKAMEQALDWSGWPSAYRLIGEGNVQLSGEV